MLLQGGKGLLWCRGRYHEGYHLAFAWQLFEAGNNNPAADRYFDDNDYDGEHGFRAVYQSGNERFEYSFARESDNAAGQAYHCPTTTIMALQ